MKVCNIGSLSSSTGSFNVGVKLVPPAKEVVVPPWMEPEQELLATDEVVHFTGIHFYSGQEEKSSVIPKHKNSNPLALAYAISKP